MIGTRPHSSGSGLRVSWWLVLILAILALVFFWWVLGACGIAMPDGRPVIYFCRAPVTLAQAPDPLAAEKARQAVLEDQISRLQLALLQRPACPPPGLGTLPIVAPPGTGGPEPRLPPRSDVAEQPQTPPQPSQPPAIPQQKWEQKDVSFLEGCWDLDASLAFHREGTDITDHTTGWEMCFDAKGVGRQRITYSGGEVCQVPIASRFLPDGRLEIRDTGAVDCSGDFTMFPQTRTCTRTDEQQAVCDWIGKRPDGTAGATGHNTFRRAS